MTLALQSIVHRSGQSRLPTRHGLFSAYAYRIEDQASEHLALTMGEILKGEPPLVRIHSECLTGDVFGSRRCDCGQQLDLAMKKIAKEQRGLVIYLSGHEGRGIGLSHKLRAYQLQDTGLDTLDANTELGFAVDLRDYGPALAILADLGVFRFRLMTNSPDKMDRLAQDPFEIVERIPLLTPDDEESRRYREAKRDRLGHYF
jgi:3,4-dihydroxy 2-butanone 4-phosphate synthase/GTP cyclohydrolase II